MSQYTDGYTNGYADGYVVITRDELDACQPCSTKFFEDSPKWDGNALVYPNIYIEALRLAKIPGATALKWLVSKKLIPITTEQAFSLIDKGKQD